MGRHWWGCGSLVLSAVLAACGGGGDPAAKPSTQDGRSAAEALSAQGETLEAFGASSVLPSSPAAASSPDTSAAAASLWFGQELAENSAGGNVAAVMPIARSFLSALPRSARGATLVEMQSALGSAQAQAIVSAPGLPVSRRLWAQKGHVFFRGFLADTQWADASQPVSNWQTAELDFAALSSAEGQAFQQALLDAGLSSQWSAFTDWEDVRLAQLDRLDVRLPIAAAAPVSAMFTLDGGTTLDITAVQLTSGVRAVTAADHAVRMVKLGAYTLLQITPAQGSLVGFSAGRLPGVIHDTLAARDAGLAVPDEMWLPVGRHVMSANPHRLAEGINLAYDKVNANLTGLDPQGGTYLVSMVSDPVFQVSAGELRFSAASLLAHVYSPENVNQTGGGSYGVILTPFLPWLPTPACPSQGPALRSSFLVILDAQERVVAVAGLRTVGGDVCRVGPGDDLGPFQPAIGN